MISDVLFGLGIAGLWASAAGLLAHHTFKLRTIWAVGIGAAVFATIILLPVTTQSPWPETAHSTASLLP